MNYVLLGLRNPKIFSLTFLGAWKNDVNHSISHKSSFSEGYFYVVEVYFIRIAVLLFSVMDSFF